MSVFTDDPRVTPDGDGYLVAPPPDATIDGWWVRPDGDGWVSGWVGHDEVRVEATTADAAIRALIGIPEAWKRTAYAGNDRVRQRPNGPFIVDGKWAVCPNGDGTKWLVFPWPECARDGYQGEPVGGPASTADELICDLIGEPR